MRDKAEFLPPAGREPSKNSYHGRQQTTRKLKLLLVEDNLPDAMMVEEAVSEYKLPMDVQRIDSGLEAIEYFAEAERNPGLCPDLLVLDLNLPASSGLEVLRHVRMGRACRHIPVVIVTSSNSRHERALANQLGIKKYFLKPYNYDEYLQVGEVLQSVMEELRPPS